MIRRNLRYLALVFSLLFVLAVGGVAHFSNQGADAYAGAVVSGDPNGAELRAVVSNGTDRVKHITYFKLESHATGGANTPVASGKVCNSELPSGVYHYANVAFQGTMAGTAPTLAIKWQNSKDGGNTWTDIGTWTTINATVTPASQSNTVADHPEEVLMNANTPVVTPAVVYGDCWRVTYTMTGTGAAAVFSVTGMEK